MAINNKMPMPMSSAMSAMSSAKVMANKMPMTKSMTPAQCANMISDKTK